MSDMAIRVEAMSKQYRIGKEQQRYRTLRETVAAGASAPLRAMRSVLRGSARQRGSEDSTIWALKDISFEVKHGEVLGIVGGNGAGKSTLLKILSRITEPTLGHADIKGRIGSLLEVGTGFHQELTGRENIFLNGAILGMRRVEIGRRFDEMVAFAEVEKFIDTQVKHYSSGMYLRLAFAVAAHLEPEILLVDEVLAVGDINFQKKCLGKMEDVAAHGRTVMFVSHNLGAVKELCKTSIVLNNGLLEFRGPVVEGLAYYSRSTREDNASTPASATGWRGIRIEGGDGELSSTLEIGQPFAAEAVLDVGDLAGGHVYCILNDAIGDMVVHQKIQIDKLLPRDIPPGRYRVRVDLPALWLAPGVYTLYFKLIGSRSFGEDVRHFSDRGILDVVGSTQITGRARLAPPSSWSITSEPLLSTTVELASDSPCYSDA